MVGIKAGLTLRVCVLSLCVCLYCGFYGLQHQYLQHQQQHILYEVSLLFLQTDPLSTLHTLHTYAAMAD